MENKLERTKEKYLEIVENRKMGGKFRQILTCGGTACQFSGGQSVFEAFKEQCKNDENTFVINTGCFGLCEEGPFAVVYPDGTAYGKLTVENVKRIVSEQLLKGKIPLDLCYNVRDGKLVEMEEMPFFKKQRRIVLRNCGKIDPLKIEEYVARDGYFALKKCLTELSAKEIIETLKESELRGRGGGGFLTGKKWELTANELSDEKYIVCNADEGDPGAFMDRAILESDPHSVIEAMIIAGIAVGAHKGYVYIRAEYVHTTDILKKALEQARAFGVLGKNILGTPFNFDIEMSFGAGLFVCGEETALMKSIEGKRGEPQPRPPYPAQKGLFGKPTLLNNVETFSNVPQIILKGAKWFSSIGTEGSKGTKVFSLSGKVKNTGLIEVPMGTTIKEMVFDICGGVAKDKKLKAVQMGGPSGGCLPADKQDVKIDYDNLISHGAMMGSGGIIVMDEDACMVDVAKFFMEFMVKESCGKCAPCRIGTTRILEILDKITKGKAQKDDLTKLKELCLQVKQNSLCGLGQTAANPVLSTLETFLDEYLTHIEKKTCPCGVCEGFKKFFIEEDKCVGCGLCAKNCPTDAISKKENGKFVINQEKCIKCGECVKSCHFGAVKKI